MIARACRTTLAPILISWVCRLASDQLAICSRKVSALQADTEIVGQCVKLKADLVLRHALAGQSRPVDSLLAFLDVLLGGAASIVEAGDLVRLHRQVDQGFTPDIRQGLQLVLAFEFR